MSFADLISLIFPVRRTDLERQLTDAVIALNLSLEQPRNDVSRDAILHRFICAWELSWRCYQVWLASREIVTRGPEEVMRAAVKKGLLPNRTSWEELYKFQSMAKLTFTGEEANRIADYIRRSGVNLLTELVNALRT